MSRLNLPHGKDKTPARAAAVTISKERDVALATTVHAVEEKRPEAREKQAT